MSPFNYVLVDGGLSHKKMTREAYTHKICEYNPHQADVLESKIRRETCLYRPLFLHS